jgi:hypothetical protein
VVREVQVRPEHYYLLVDDAGVYHARSFTIREDLHRFRHGHAFHAVDCWSFIYAAPVLTLTLETGYDIHVTCLSCLANLRDQERYLGPPHPDANYDPKEISK